MKKGIIICGLNGCGKTTTGREVAARLCFKRMDVEDYYFLDSEIPFSVSRTKDEVRELMWADIQKHKEYVLSSVGCDWGEKIENTYALAVFLTAPKETRMARIDHREIVRFGDRVLEGGDMYEQQKRFRQFVSGRSEEPYREQIKKLPCPVLELDSTQPLDVIVEKICRAYSEITS
ncbi:MAG: AAA family ATPase [Firmicutes bacterium]|nr:AAA family ATPase [Bacillota bacterium]